MWTKIATPFVVLLLGVGILAWDFTWPFAYVHNWLEEQSGF